jgi:hypothetical protein
MNEMVKLLGGDDVVAKIEAAPYSARVRAQHLFEDAPQRTAAEGEDTRKAWVGLTDEEFQMIYDMGRTPAGMMEMVEAKLKEKNT